MSSTPPVTRLMPKPNCRRHLQSETHVYSDGLGAFRAVVDLGHAQTVIETAGGRAGTEEINAHWVNIVLRWLDGAYIRSASSSMPTATWPWSRGASIAGSSWTLWYRAC